MDYIRLLRYNFTLGKSNKNDYSEILSYVLFILFIGRTDAEVEAPVLWPPDVNRLIGKDPGTRKVWRQKKGMTEEELVGWHHRHNGHEFEQIPGDGDGQGSLVCCSPWDLKESDTTESLNNNNNNCLLKGFPGVSVVKYLPANKCKRRRFDPWSRKWQCTPVYLTGKSHGWRSLASYSPRSHKRVRPLSD